MAARYHASVSAILAQTVRDCARFFDLMHEEVGHLQVNWESETADAQVCSDFLNGVLNSSRRQESQEAVVYTALERIIAQISSGNMTVQAAIMSIGSMLQRKHIETVGADDTEPVSPTATPRRGSTVSFAAQQTAMNEALESVLIEPKEVQPDDARLMVEDVHGIESKGQDFIENEGKFFDDLSDKASDFLAKLGDDASDEDVLEFINTSLSNNESFGSFAPMRSASMASIMSLDDEFEHSVEGDTQLNMIVQTMTQAPEKIFSLLSMDMDFEPSVEGDTSLTLHKNESMMADPATTTGGATLKRSEGLTMSASMLQDMMFDDYEPSVEGDTMLRFRPDAKQAIANVVTAEKAKFDASSEALVARTDRAKEVMVQSFQTENEKTTGSKKLNVKQKAMLLALDDKVDELKQEEVKKFTAQVISAVTEGEDSAEKAAAVIERVGLGESANLSRVEQLKMKRAAQHNQAIIKEKTRRLNNTQAKEGSDETNSSDVADGNLLGATPAVEATSIAEKTRLTAIDKAHQAKEFELRKAHEQKRRALELAMKNKLHKEEAGINAYIDNIFAAQGELAWTDDSAALQNLMAEKSSALSAAETHELVKQHEALNSTRNKRMKAEKERQKSGLGKRLAASRARKADRLANLNKLELQEVAGDQLVERAAAVEAGRRDEILSNEAGAVSVSADKKGILQKMQQSHAREKLQLEEQQRVKTKVRIEKDLQACSDARATLRAAMEDTHARAMVRFVADNSALDEDEFNGARDELEADQAAELKAFDDATDGAMTDARGRAEKAAEIQTGLRLLELRERQCIEMATTLSSISPDNSDAAAAMIEEFKKVAGEAAEAAMKARETLIAENEAKITKIKEDRLGEYTKRVSEQKSALQQELDEIQAEIDAERQRGQKEAELKVQKRKGSLSAITAEVKQMDVVVADASAAIMQELAEDQKAALQGLADSKAQLKANLAAKLAAKKAKKAAKIKAQGALFERSSSQQVSGEGNADADVDFGQLELHPDTKAAAEHNAAKLAAAQAKLQEKLDFDFTNVQPEDWDMIVSKVDSIESQVKKKNQFVFATVFDGDECDWQNTASSLEEATVASDQLTPAEITARDFATGQAQLMSTHWNLPIVTITIVSNLVPTPNNGNAFQRSYSYSSTQNSLCVRRERFADAGLLGMVVLHGMAHVKIRNFSDDTNPEFLNAFYDGLQVRLPPPPFLIVYSCLCVRTCARVRALCRVCGVKHAQRCSWLLTRLLSLLLYVLLCRCLPSSFSKDHSSVDSWERAIDEESHDDETTGSSAG